MVNRIGDLFTDVYTPKPDEFNVILHGDLWVNNIMFQHDEKGLPTEVLFVDYQMSRYGSPVQDLMYFILSSTEYSIKVKEFDFMIKYYYRELVKNLKLLKYPKAPPTLIDLHVALVKKCYFGNTPPLEYDSLGRSYMLPFCNFRHFCQHRCHAYGTSGPE